MYMNGVGSVVIFGNTSQAKIAKDRRWILWFGSVQVPNKTTVRFEGSEGPKKRPNSTAANCLPGSATEVGKINLATSEKFHCSCFNRDDKFGADDWHDGSLGEIR